MNFDFSEPLPKFFLLLRREVLIAEEYHAPLGDQQSQFVPLLRGEVFELKPFDFRPDVGSQIRHLLGRGEQILLGLVSPGSGVLMWALIVSYLVDILQIQRYCMQADTDNRWTGRCLPSATVGEPALEAQVCPFSAQPYQQWMGRSAQAPFWVFSRLEGCEWWIGWECHTFKHSPCRPC